MKRDFHSKIFCFELENNKTINGKYIELFFENFVDKKIFFKTKDEKREFCVKNISINFDDPNWVKFLSVTLNEYFEFLLNQSRLEFPEWLSINGSKASISSSVYSVEEIFKEWKSMKNLFGIYRIAAECGFYTSKKPLDCKQIKILTVKELIS